MKRGPTALTMNCLAKAKWEAQLVKSQFAAHFDLKPNLVKAASLSNCTLSPSDCPGAAD